MTDPVTSDSNQYEVAFYGILNREGVLWSPMPFDSERAAQDRLDRFHLDDSTHKIVPVRVQLTVITEGQPND